MKNLFFFLLGLVCVASSCIKDDIIEDRVDPQLRITNPIDTLEINTSYQLEANFLNNVGREETVSLSWSSSAENVITVSDQGELTALQSGNSIITVDATAPSGELVTDEFMLAVGESTVVAPPVTERTGTAQTTTFYELEGDFSLREEGDNLILSFADNYVASSSLPGFYLYMTNNPNSIAGAYEVSKITTFSGAHSYEIPLSDVGLMDYEYLLFYCKPFNVKVGDGQFEN
jgi:hypothetical protein